MFLISGSYGEWDDYTRLPIMVVPDKDTAELVVDELNRPNNQFISKVKALFGQENVNDICFSYDAIEYIEIC